MLSAIEQTRLHISKNTEPKKKAQYGQYLTPAKTAAFMAGLFPDGKGICRLLDAGAGVGSLSAAFLDRWKDGGFHFQQVVLDAFELDPVLTEHLAQTLERYKRNGDFSCNIHGIDFIHAVVESLGGSLFSKPLERCTHAILNPPYKKIKSDSGHRLALRRIGIETVNLYSAFVSLAVALSAPGGEIVAIIPRSFCNGPYYRPFRDFILQRTALCHIHLFGSRNKAFKDDEVLQENIIIHLKHGGQQGLVKVSTSSDDSFHDLAIQEYQFDRIVFPDDPERFIHVPTSPGQNVIELSSVMRCTIEGLGISVSTGPVVDFRLKAHLRDMPGPGSTPLLYPGHCRGGSAKWPIKGMKKPNAIENIAETEKWLYPIGFYCVVRRFSSKEEKRRIVASVIEPTVFGDAQMLGLENHLNVFHDNRHGLPEPLARGLTVFLNSTIVDESFRRFSGHTQVNATDLKLMKYPSRDALDQLGLWAAQQGELTQEQIDVKIQTLIT